MAVSIRFNDKDTALLRAYAKLKNRSVSDVVRDAVIGQIEDEYDIAAYKQAMLEFNEDPVVYTQEEVERELGLRV